jgi:hypothetical protein
MDRKINLTIPDLEVTAAIKLLTDRAPLTCAAIWDVLAEPVERRLIHTATTGSIVLFYNLPALAGARDLPVENHTIYPRPGEVLYFYKPWNALRDLADFDPAWLQLGDDVHEVMFAYGAANLRMPTEEGWQGTVWGNIEDGLDDFARACRRMRMDGTKQIRMSRQL